MRKIKVPLSAERTEVSLYNYYFNEKKMLILFGVFIAAVAITFALIKILGSLMVGGMVLGLWIGGIGTIVAYFYLFRFVIFEEKRQRRLLKSLQDEQISPYSAFWNISRIDDNGLIHFKPDGDSIKKAIVIKVTRGSIVGRHEHFFDNYHQTIAAFYRDLFGEGYKVRQYSLSEFGEEPENLKYLVARANAIEDEQVRRLAIMYTNNFQAKMNSARAIEIDYFMIYCDSYYGIRDFNKKAVGIMLKNFESNFFKDKRVLNSDEVEYFFTQILQLRSLPYIAGEAIVPFEEYGEVTRAFDSDGREINIDELENEISDEDGDDFDEELDESSEEDESPSFPTRPQRVVKEYDIDFNRATSQAIKTATDEFELVRVIEESTKKEPVEEESNNLLGIIARKKGDRPE